LGLELLVLPPPLLVFMIIGNLMLHSDEIVLQPAKIVFIS
jgi:hypothetical protein